MSAAAANVSGEATPEARPSRAIRLIRVGVLLVAAIAIAFSATMHEQLGFDLTVAALALAGIGVAHVIEATAPASAGRRTVPALLAGVALFAAVLVPMSATAIGFAVVIAAWSLVSALLEFLGNAIRPGSRPDVIIVGASGFLLALFVLLARQDQVAILGFFGGYAVIAGVFLGISAFDTQRESR
ncbi:hypothetical protein JD292_07725 [Leucobacter sp. CSA2]|uniref:Uncharacterized protein n=2 Tax=Leucobacter edaphi TaxID=2796472 RepID=A0A934QD10_9MICO|nr:hypothetical protein [Leucobacter edaphi]MBK0421963.1 hypothetical protein [Leucobacter edaphi]